MSLQKVENAASWMALSEDECCATSISDELVQRSKYLDM
jgi:hypothetical protein